MSIKQFKLSAQAREQLIRLKTRTGIGQWNILCRWAFCLSLRQPSPPTPVEIPADSNVAPRASATCCLTRPVRHTAMGGQ